MIYLATDNGLVICEREDEWRIVHRGLEGHRVTSLTGREGAILAGTANGVFRSADNGQNWADASAGLSHLHVRWLAYHPDVPHLVFAGTEPAAIFISQDGGNSWRERREVSSLREKHGWFLPYSPESGCVRGFDFHGERGYAAVEVGGALRSDDFGESWQLAEGSNGDPRMDDPPEPGIHPDVHSIHVHPSSLDLVDAPTGGGFYRSADGGRTWEFLYDCYCRSVWTDPADPTHLILGPADGVSSNGRIEETRDGGRTWTLASEGLDVPWRRNMVERFVQIGSELFAVLSNGELLYTRLPALNWKRIFPDVEKVNALTGV